MYFSLSDNILNVEVQYFTCPKALVILIMAFVPKKKESILICFEKFFILLLVLVKLQTALGSILFEISKK